jgi:serine/threonine protein kinase
MAPDKRLPDENSKSQPPSDDSLLVAGDFIAENLRVISFLGSGGMSHIYKCEDGGLARIVAVKTLRAGFSPDSLRRLQTEGRAIARLEHHNIVRLYGLRVRTDAEPILIMEFVDGVSLAALLEQEGSLSVARSLHIAKQIAEGLRAAHKEGIVHRDLKPANIMIVNAGSDDERVKILDFGIAKIQSEISVKATQTGEVFGTPQYMSPEQAMGKKCDGLSDQYSFGCVLFEMLCGHPPFEHESLVALLISHAQEQAPALKKSMKEPPSKELQKVVSTLLQKNPADRYESMYEVIQSISKASEKKSAALNLRIVVAIAAVALVALVGSVCTFKAIESKKQKYAEERSSSLASSAPAIAPHSSNELTVSDKIMLDEKDKYIHNNELVIHGEPISDAGLAELVRNKTFKRISVRGCIAITADGIAKINPSLLEFLDLADTAVKDNVVKSLSKMSSLRDLSLTDTLITSDACKGIANIAGLTAFEARATRIDGRALTYLAGFKHLADLDLSVTKITGSLKNLKDSPVQHLNLSQVQLLPADFEDGILHMKNLRRLTVNSTNITNDELQKLSQLKGLSEISLKDCASLSEANIYEFHKKAPLCLIILDKNAGNEALLPAVRSADLAGPDLVSNGDFEEGQAPELHQICLQKSKEIPHWEVTRDSITWVNRHEREPASGNNSIELTSHTYGTLQQKLSTTPQTRYCVRFKVAASPMAKKVDQPLKQQLQVQADFQRVNCEVWTSSDNNSEMRWRDFTWTFTALEKQTTLQFSCDQPGAIGPCIDMVSVRKLANR